ncbi:MAG: hypothetical protein U0231_17290 [Nitrospiraceae bacterium]
MPTDCITRNQGGTRGRDYRGGNFHKNIGMRIDYLLVTKSLQQRVVWTEIDREARKEQADAL